MGKRNSNTKNAVMPLSREDYLRRLAASKVPFNIRLTNNYAFRKAFKNKTVLKGFVMALLNLGEKEILELEVTDPFEEGEGEDEKEGILDVKVHLNNCKKINIEMQNRYQDDWPERSIFYNCRMFTEGFIQGSTYGEIEPCIHVGILDFNQLEDMGYHHKILLMDEKSGELYSSKFIFHVIELKKLAETSEEEKGQELYRWAKIIAARSWEEVCMEAKGNPYMEAAKDVMDKINKSETERYLYLRQEMAITDEKSRLATAERKGREEGKVEGEILKLISLIQKKCQKGKTLEVVAEELEEDMEDIRNIYRVANEYPERSPEDILAILKRG